MEPVAPRLHLDPRPQAMCSGPEASGPATTGTTCSSSPAPADHQADIARAADAPTGLRAGDPRPDGAGYLDGAFQCRPRRGPGMRGQVGEETRRPLTGGADRHFDSGNDSNSAPAS